MSRFTDEIRPVLLAVSKLSGPDYDDVEEAELRAELVETTGREYDYASFNNLMFMLRDDDPGHLAWHRSASHGYKRIRLTGPGREIVEGWPTSGGVTDTDLAALLEAVTAAVDDPNVSDENRGKLRAVRDNLKGVPSGVATGILTAWLKGVSGVG